MKTNEEVIKELEGLLEISRIPYGLGISDLQKEAMVTLVIKQLELKDKQWKEAIKKAIKSIQLVYLNPVDGLSNVEWIPLHKLEQALKDQGINL